MSLEFWYWSSAPGAPAQRPGRHLSERTGVDSIRNLVSVLVQSEQFGTSVAKTLRVHSDTMRAKRIQQVEEMAAKTSVKLVFPLVFFIFPALFLVTLGPAVILMMESFKTFFATLIKGGGDIWKALSLSGSFPGCFSLSCWAFWFSAAVRG